MTETVVANTLTESFVIEGGQPLHGKVRAAGNKNGVLPILAACVLTSERVELHNVPRIRDVDTMLELLADIGVEVDWIGPNDVRVHAAEIRKTELDHELCLIHLPTTTLSYRCATVRARQRRQTTTER